MLCCCFFSDGNGFLVGFEISGHASGEKRGNNLVCAGVTTLAQTCIASITTLLGVSGEIQKGEAGYLKYSLTHGSNTETDLLIRSMVIGLEYLQKAGGDPSGIKIEYTHSGGNHKWLIKKDRAQAATDAIPKVEDLV